MKSARNYPLLLASQFLSAFGDNAILAVIVGQLTLMHKAGDITSDQLRLTNTIYTSLLFIPYVLLAPLAGYVNDRYPKTTWLRRGNLFKIAGTLVCALSVWFGYIWQGPGYFIVGIGSCLYGPAKYGILPEILPRERLVKANGMVELLTLVAILTGMIAGSVIIDRLPVSFCYGILLTIFALSWALNWFMQSTPWNPEVRLKASASEFALHFKSLMTAPRLGKVLIGTALFWVCGAAMKINFQPWGLDVLRLPDNTQIALLGLWLSVGVMAGSLLAGRLHQVGDLRRSRGYGFILAGMLGLVFLVEPLGWAAVGRFEPAIGANAHMVLILPVIGILTLAGVFAGLFLIPLNAALQAESDPAKLGKTIAAQNVMDNLGMISAALLVLVCVHLKLTSSQVFLALALVIGAVIAWLRFPQSGEVGSDEPVTNRR